MATGPVKPTSIPNPLASTAGADKAGEAQKSNKTSASERAGASTNGTPGNYDVQISSQAKQRAEFRKKLFDAAKDSPEIREDRVAELKARIAEGSYKVDTGKVADAMLREAVRDHLALNEK